MIVGVWFMDIVLFSWSYTENDTLRVALGFIHGYRTHWEFILHLVCRRILFMLLQSHMTWIENIGCQVQVSMTLWVVWRKTLPFVLGHIYFPCWWISWFTQGLEVRDRAMYLQIYFPCTSSMASAFILRVISLFTLTCGCHCAMLYHWFLYVPFMFLSVNGTWVRFFLST